MATADYFLNGSRQSPQPNNRHPADLADFRFARDVEQLHRLGPRALLALLTELGARHLIRTPIELLVAEYGRRLDRKILRALGGDHLPPAPLHRLRVDRAARR